MRFVAEFHHCDYSLICAIMRAGFIGPPRYLAHVPGHRLAFAPGAPVACFVRNWRLAWYQDDPEVFDVPAVAARRLADWGRRRGIALRTIPVWLLTNYVHWGFGAPGTRQVWGLLRAQAFVLPRRRIRGRQRRVLPDEHDAADSLMANLWRGMNHRFWDGRFPDHACRR